MLVAELTLFLLLIDLQSHELAVRRNVTAKGSVIEVGQGIDDHRIGK